MEALAFVRTWIGGLLAGFVSSVAFAGCGPVCRGTPGSCLDLYVNAPGGSGTLGVWLAGTDAANLPITVAATAQGSVSLPTHVLVAPPPYVRQVQRVSAQLLGGSTELLYSGGTAVNWPSGSQIEATLKLSAPKLTFSQVQAQAMGRNPVAVVSLDADHNGIPDLVVANQDTVSGGVSLLLGQGNGQFGPAQQVSTVTKPAALIAADLNSDGLADLGYAIVNSSNVSVQLGVGNGTFQAASGFSSVVSDPGLLLARDLDADGKPDLLVAGGTGSIQVLWNAGNATFPSGTTVRAGGPLRIPLDQGSVGLADLNDDGLPDLVAVANDGENALNIWMNKGGHSFAPSSTLDLNTSVFKDSLSPSVAAFDYDGDTRVDLLVTTRKTFGDEATRRFYKGDGRGQFAAPVITALSFDSRFVFGSDINGDLAPDLLVVDQPALGAVSELHLALGKGTGGFHNVVCAPSSCQFLTPPVFLATQDLNADQKPDLIVVTSASGSGAVSILLRTD